MGSADWRLSERVLSTVADALDRDPLELPPLEETISADALDYLFHRENHPPGAYTVFPYCDLWVVAHSSGAVDVFETYRATTGGERLPEGVPEPSTDERMVMLHFEDEQHHFYEHQLDTLHQILSDADDSDEAWADAIEYARRQVET